MSRPSRNILLVAAAVLVLSACGKKGALESPKPEADEKILAPDSKPKTGGRPFLLDPLVR